MKHLTDEEFQSYLDGTPGCPRAEIERHLAECPQCNLGLEQYRIVYSALADDSGFELSPGFTRNMVDRLELAARPEQRTHLAVGWVAAVAVMLAAIYYFWSSFAVFGRFSLNYAVQFAEWTDRFTALNHWLREIGIRVDLILVSLAILALFGAIDQLLRHLRRSRAMLSF